MFSSDSDWSVVHEETNDIIHGIKARHKIRHLIRISKSESQNKTLQILTVLSANAKKWSNTLKRFVGNSRRIV